MKKINLSIVALMAASSMAMAGGDMTPVEVEVVAPVVMADTFTPGFYIGAGYSAQASDVMDYSYDVQVDIDSNNMLFVAGYDINRYVAIEGRYSFSVGDVDLNEDSGYSESSSDYETSNIALYVKPQYMMDNGFGVYALLGYGKTTFENLTETGDDTGFAWGLGAKYTYNDSWGVFVDYTDLVSDGSLDGIEAYAGVAADLDVQTDSWNFGVTYKF